MRYLFIAFVLFAACKQQPKQLEEKKQVEEKRQVEEKEQTNEVLLKLHSEPFAGLEGKMPDTLVISYQSAVIFAPDSFKINKQIKAVGEEYYRIGYDDEAGLFHEADEFFESVKLPSVFADSCNYIKFVQQNGTITIIKTDSLKDLYGLFLFDPKKPPKLADVTMAEEEYAKYFK